MSRVPENTKNIFTALAEEEFCGDYGLCLKSILDGHLMFKAFFENVDMKLDILVDKSDSIINLVDNEEINEEKPKGKMLLNGRTV